MNYSDALQIESEVIPGIINRTIARSYSTSGFKGRPTELSIAASNYSTAWVYDEYGRLNRVTGPGLPAYGAVYGRVVSARRTAFATKVAQRASRSGAGPG